ncbi:unnamed protein product [Ceutorhynchus assimilis]|uniref:Uncharacterized protein n=1 Tax=Ceutorhynchus assimilis TaxID=467358 RepID=A0A9N9MPR2_9CUCU|nr:unnamed protein product [Ceutorhynchus assimilis]
MGSKWRICLMLSAYFVALSFALPSSLVEEIKSSEVKSNNKVKRAQPTTGSEAENIGRMSYFNSKPTSAIKRGTNLKDSDLSDWTGGDQLFRNAGFNLDNVQSGLYNPANLPLMDDKSIAEYEKGYRYGTNKDKLDEALENAVLKGELYGDPYNQYNRFYGSDDRRRKRGVASSKQRSKRNIDLTPEEILALLTLYETNQKSLKESENYRQPIVRYNKNYDTYDLDLDGNDNDNNNWLNGPVYPHATIDQLPENYLYDYGTNQQQPVDYKARWGTFDDAKKKRFFVAKKRTSDPTRMIRYINGPSQNDFNTLSTIINNQKDAKPEIPIYRRFVL